MGYNQRWLGLYRDKLIRWQRKTRSEGLGEGLSLSLGPPALRVRDRDQVGEAGRSSRHQESRK